MAFSARTRFRLPDVPRAVRELRTATAPIALRYERVCFDRAATRIDGKPVAELLAPGPSAAGRGRDAHDRAVRGCAAAWCGARGRLDPSEEHRLLVAVSEEIVDSLGRWLPSGSGTSSCRPTAGSGTGRRRFWITPRPRSRSAGSWLTSSGGGGRPTLGRWPSSGRPANTCPTGSPPSALGGGIWSSAPGARCATGSTGSNQLDEI
jgi:hypothetical protein